MRPVASPVSSPVGSPVSLHPKIGKFLPSQLPGLQMWCRHASGLTIAGQGVSQWDDQSGNGNHLLQGTDANRPSGIAGGSEHLSNNNFATDLTGWSEVSHSGSGANAWTANGIQITNDGADSLGGGEQSITTVSGTRYEITAVVDSTDGTARFGAGSSSGTTNLANDAGNGTGTHTLNFVATGTTTYINCWSEGNGAVTVFSSMSVKETNTFTDGILFDGVDDFLRSTFTLNQPWTWYLAAKRPTYSTNLHLVNGVTNNVAMSNSASTPDFRIYAGTAQAATNSDWAVNTYAAVCAVYDGASSLTQVDLNTAATGNPGAAAAGGVTVGASQLDVSFANIQVKEMIVYNTAHDAATRTRVYGYLQGLL